MRILFTKLRSSCRALPMHRRWAILVPCLSLLALGLAVGVGHQQLLAENPPEEEPPVIIGFSSFEMVDGEWELSGQVINHQGPDTVIDFGDFLAGESVNADNVGFFVHYCFGAQGEIVSAIASCSNGVSDEEVIALE